MDRVSYESIRLYCRYLADLFVGHEAAAGLEPACEVVACQEVGEIGAQLNVAIVLESLDCRALGRAVYPFELTGCPLMIAFGQGYSILFACYIMSKRLATIIRRQLRVPQERDDDSVHVKREHDQLTIPRPARKIENEVHLRRLAMVFRLIL